MYELNREIDDCSEWREACANGSVCNISRFAQQNNSMPTSEQLDYFADVASMDTQIGPKISFSN